jgi:hypothetical protein
MANKYFSYSTSLLSFKKFHYILFGHSKRENKKFSETYFYKQYPAVKVPCFRKLRYAKLI